MTPATRLAALLLPAGLAFLAAQAARAGDIDFNRDVRPILSNNCYACHGPDDKVRKADLRLDTRDGATENGAVVPGRPDESELIRRVRSDESGEVMPPPKTGKKLTGREVELLTEWVKQGAPYAKHWSYVKPERPPLPVVKNNAWARNGIDLFILARLEREGLRPQPEADRYALIRRASLDLTGLPPTVEEVDAFVNDPAPNAYEKLIDRLLAKPAFGEHWARLWLDLARYADSAGYADDPPRTIWAYRDYVIRSFNANKPFDRFTVEQIAGDLLPGAAEEQLIATAFHRNTLTNNEGGTSDEEFRNVAVVDRVNTTMAVWMGTSMACAQCHTHKYDPISQTEYFRFFAFFNNTEDADRADESPVLEVGDTPARKKLRTELTAEAAKLDRLARFQPAVIQAGLKIQADLLRKRAELFKPETTVPIMRELPPDKRRVTKLQYRGNFLDTGDTVTEGVPAAFHPLPEGAAANRLTLARWLVSPDNPLTPRVTANRFWEQIFGTGLVRTSEEFGSQGELPSHPELLDWLAVEFRDGGWDVKRFLKLLVTSAAYRQSSRVTPELLAKDPDNRLLSRGPRFRLPAETVRDQALFVSGLLSSKMYGPSVKPPQPEFGLTAAFGRTLDWKPSDGEDRYRRGLYTEWRRTNPYPSMTTFDAPSREACALRRDRTNTPLQALVTLNDPVYVEAAQALARRMSAAKGTPAEKLTHGFRLCVARPPSEKELAVLVKLYEEARAKYAADPAKAAKMAADPLGPAPKGVDVAELAALTVVGNVLLNLDEMILKR
jgi:mono/diheme cytochrome c family protein